MIELFLICALSLPASNFIRPAIASYHAAKSEQEQLRDFENWFKRRNPGIDVMIRDVPQSEKVKEYGWERFPANIFGKQIWIRRKPATDKPKRGVSHGTIESAA